MAQAKKKKKFFEVPMNLLNKTTYLYAYEVEDLDGKIIQYDLTRMLKGKSSLLQLRVNVRDGQVQTFPKKFRILPYFLKRAVRKGTNYVEDSFSAQCKDGQLRIKPILVTRRKVPRRVRKALREKAREEIIEYVKNKTIEKVFEAVLKLSLQKHLHPKLKKIYPLSLCEIRVLQVEKENGEGKSSSTN